MSVRSYPAASIGRPYGATARAGIFSAAPHAQKRRQTKLSNQFLLQVLVCIVPGLLLVRMGALRAGVKVYFVSLLAFLAWHVLTLDFARYFALLVATIPVMMPLRKLFLFNTLLGAVVVGLVGWCIISPQMIGHIRRNKGLLFLAVLTGIYWWASFVATGTYSTNLRILDLTATACVVYLLWTEGRYLQVALTGMAISVVLVAFALAPYGDRLGIAVVQNVEIGNPIEMGLGSGLIFLLVMAEDAVWLYTGKMKSARWAILIASLLCLLLSTSRGGWLTVLTAILVLFAYASKDRGKIIACAVLITMVISGLIASGHGDTLVKYYNKVASPDRTLSQKTTLRSDQWVTVARVLDLYPVLGMGVGQGYNANVEYGGQQFVFHSLYLQIAAETGLLGLTLLFVFLVRVMTDARRLAKKTGEVVPLMAVTGFMAIGLSVSGFDPLSGVYLGLALLTVAPVEKRARQMRVPYPSWRLGNPVSAVPGTSGAALTTGER